MDSRGGITSGGIPEAVIDSPLPEEFVSTPMFECKQRSIIMKHIYSSFGIIIIKQSQRFFTIR